MTDPEKANDLAQLGTEALHDLLNNLTQAKGFILSQAPEFCQQLVMREMTMPLFAGALELTGALVTIFALWMFKLTYRSTCQTRRT